MDAFTSRVRDVSAGRASATGFVHTGGYLLRFMGVLDAMYVAAGMEPRPSTAADGMRERGTAAREAANGGGVGLKERRADS
eukprot:66429-Prymnesium_polylepis.1